MPRLVPVCFALLLGVLSYFALQHGEAKDDVETKQEKREENARKREHVRIAKNNLTEAEMQINGNPPEYLMIFHYLSR